jgi:hypothetical protein
MGGFFIEMGQGLSGSSFAFLALATLLALISLRSSDIATRVRKNNELIADEKSSDAKRRISLQEQNRLLCARYVRLSWAFCLATACASLLTLAWLIRSSATESAGLLVLSSILLAALALVLLALEFASGHRTLQMDCASVEP